MFAVLYNANMHDYNQTGKKMKFFFFYSSDERQEQLIEVISRCFGDIIHIRSKQSLQDNLNRYPQAIVISPGRPAEHVENFFGIYKSYPYTLFVYISNYFLPPDTSISSILKNVILLKPIMCSIILKDIVNTYPLLSRRRYFDSEHPVLKDDYSGFIMKVNYKTKVKLMSDRHPKHVKVILRLLLNEYDTETIAQNVGTGIRQVWLTEQALKKRYKIPENMSLHEALFLK